MTVPMVQYATVFDAISASTTVALAQVSGLGQTHTARAIFLEINGASTPSWTLAIQGRATPSGTWHNIDFFRTDQGAAVALSASTLTVDWSTAQYYVIPSPPPFVRLVGTRTTGTLTVYASFSSEAYSVSSGTAGLVSQGYGVAATITRPANQTPYTANDVVGGALSLGVCGRASENTLLQSIRLRANITAVPSGMGNFRVALYNVTPPSAIADNAAWTLASGDLASYLGLVDLGTPALPAAASGAIVIERDNVGKEMLLGAAATIFGYLITDGAFTPAANSEVYVVTPKFVGI